jgi:hypothetical protein
MRSFYIITKWFTWTLIFVACTFGSSAQNVGIGTATPLEKLHVVGNIRSSTLAGVGNRVILADPNGTLIVAGAGLSPAWLTTGNSGTVAGTNFIGTLDAIDFVIKTGGSLAVNERLRALSSGQLIANSNAIFNGDVLSVYGTGYASSLNSLGNSVINGYLRATGTALYGENQDTSISSSGLYAIASTPGTGRASSIWGDNTSATGYAIRGQATNAGGGIGVIGFTAAQAGLQGQASGAGDGVRAYNTSAASGAGDGVFGYAAYGGGVSFSSAGVFGYNNMATGLGMIGGIGGGGIFALNAGAGGAFSGTKFGITAFVGKDSSMNAAAPPSAGGYFYCNNGAFAYVGARIAGTNYKVTGTGTAGTFVRDLNNEYRIMACPEAPEILFQDYGTGQLANGMAYINLDPILTKNILVDEAHPLKVFIQLEDECNGVFVTDKSATGFMVKELAGGVSNAKFSWSIVANRADEKDLNGNVISQNSNNRFVPAPAMESRSAKPMSTQLEQIEKPATAAPAAKQLKQ